MIAKAPWWVDMDSIDKQWRDSVSIKDAEGGHVAHLTRGYEGDEGEGGPSLANARLIAAAPDMLAMLQQIYEFAVTDSASVFSMILIQKMCHAAIEKATGS